MDYKNTIVNDKLDLDSLECQFYGICKSYTPGACMYGEPCKAYLTLTTGARLTVKHVLSNCLEESIIQESLKFQVGLLKP